MKARTPRPEVAPVEPDPARREDRIRQRELLQRPRPLFETTPRFAPDGVTLVYLSNRRDEAHDGALGDSPRRRRGPRSVYVERLDDDSGPRRVAEAPARMRRPFVSHDGHYLFYTEDDAGNEAYAVFRMRLSTGKVEAMTPTDSLRRDGAWFTEGGERFFFTAREHHEKGLSLYEQDRKTGEPRLVYDNPSLRMVAMREDSSEMLLVDATLSNELYVLSLPAEGTPRRLFPAEGVDARIHGVAFSHLRRDRVFVATDDGGEGAHVLELDLETGEETARYSESRYPGARLRSMRVAAGRLAFIVDAGVRHDVRVLDAATLEPMPYLDLPLGSEVPGATHPNQTDGLTMAHDGRRLVVQWSTPRAPAHLLLVDTENGTHRRLHPDTEDDPRPAFVTEVVTIPSFDGLELPTLVHRKPGSGKAPVVVLLHGGFALASTARWDMSIDAFIEEGYAVIEPNLRGSGGFGRAFEAADDGMKKLEAARDLTFVGRWLGERPWADEDRLALSGGSVGGYFTLLGLALSPELWRAGVCVSGMFDLESMLRETDGDLAAYLQEELVPLDEPGLLAALSPASYIDRIRAPLFVVAGENDARTPRGQADALVRALRARRRPVEYMCVPSQGHGFSDPRVRAELNARTLRFLRDAFTEPRTSER